MPVSAKMIFTQAPGGTRPAGYDVNDGAVGNLVTITNANNAGIKSWQLTMKDVPVGPETDCTSAVPKSVFASGSSPLVSGTFTPDKIGKFRIVLDVQGTDGSSARDVGTFGCPNELGWSRPSFQQGVEDSKYGGQTRGWANDGDKIQSSARTAHSKTLHLKQEHVFVGSLKETDQTSFVIVGGRRVNPANYATAVGLITRTMTFRCEMYATPGMTAQVRLFNFTDGGVVASSVLSTSSNTPVALSAVLATPTDLPNALKMYECQLRISAGVPGPTDRAFLLNAYLDITLDG